MKSLKIEGPQFLCTCARNYNLDTLLIHIYFNMHTVINVYNSMNQQLKILKQLYITAV